MPEVLATRHRRRRNASASSRQRAGGALIDPGPLSVGKWWVRGRGRWPTDTARSSTPMD